MSVEPTEMPVLPRVGLVSRFRTELFMRNCVSVSSSSHCETKMYALLLPTTTAYNVFVEKYILLALLGLGDPGL
jgi:hypothetical protein